MKIQKHWILLIEDDPDIRLLLSEQLTQTGFSILACSKVTEGMRILRNQRFDCILLDLRLEGGTGSQILYAIREDKQNLNNLTPVIVISGQVSLDILLKIKTLVSAVFVKPFEMSQLIAKVKYLCPVQNSF